MKRKLKNTIMVLMCVLLVGSIAFTAYYAKEHVSNANSVMSNGHAQNNNGGPPSMPGDNNQSSSNNSSSDESSDNNSSSNMQSPPEKPDGDSSDNFGSTPPDMPGGNNQNSSNGGPGMEMNSNKSSSISSTYYILFAVEGLVFSAIILYLLMSKFNKKSFKETFSSSDKAIIYMLSSLILTSGLTFGSAYVTNNYLLKNNSSKNSISENGMPGSSSTNATYSGKTEINKSTSITSGNYKSTNSDENAILVSGDADVNISNIEVNKSGDSDGGDNTSFYGTNSGIVAKDGAKLTLKNIKVTTNATGANGVFSYGGSATTNNSNSDGTTINISDSEITTKKDNSGGIMTTGGGVMNAKNLTINTAGTSSAAIRSDRGGGIVTVDGGTYKTTGKGSPTIYSTADITVKNAKLVATASEGVVIEGKNSVSLDNVSLTDTNNTLNGQSTTYKNIFLYQSMSGDAANGNSEFSAKNSNIVTNKGDTFYITNTSSTITLENNKITNNDNSGNFLRAKADSWGSNGSNGGIVTLLMNKQTVNGNIVIDSISTLDMTMKNSSSYTGTINGANTAKSIKLKLDKSSKIKLTGNSYVTSLDNADSSNSNIDFNGYKLYVNGKAIN